MKVATKIKSKIIFYTSRPIKCPFCGSDFFKLSLFNIHSKQCHKKSKDDENPLKDQEEEKNQNVY